MRSALRLVLACGVLTACGAPSVPVDVGSNAPALAPPPRAPPAPAPVPAPIEAEALPAPDLSRGVCVNGACWVSPLPTGHRIHAISGNASLVVAVGEGGTILTWDGTELRAERSPEPVDLFDVYAEEPGREVAVGANGAVFRRMVIESTGPTWIAYDCPTTQRLRAVHGARGGPIIAAGDGGTLFDVERECAPIPTAVRSAFVDVHVAGSTWFAVSADRVITFEDRRPVATWMAAGLELRSIAGADADHVVVLGDHGWLTRRGARWDWIDRADDPAQVWTVGAPDARRIVSAAGCEIRGDACVETDLLATQAAISAPPITALWRGASGPWWLARDGRLAIEPDPAPAPAARVDPPATSSPPCTNADGTWDVWHDAVVVDERRVFADAALDLVGIACTDDATWVAAIDGTILRCVGGDAPTCLPLPRRARGSLAAIATVRGEVWVFGDDEGAYAARANDPLLEVHALGLGRRRIESVQVDAEGGLWILVSGGRLRFEPAPAPPRVWIPRDDERVTVVPPHPHVGAIVGAAIDANGARGVTVGADGTAALHDLRTGEVLAAIYGIERSTRAPARFEGTSVTLQTAGTRRWSLADGTLRSREYVPTRELRSDRAVRHSARGIELCLTSTSIRWPRHCDVLEPTARGRALDVSHDGMTIVGLSDDGLLHVLDRATDSSSSVRLEGIAPTEARVTLALPRWAVAITTGERLWVVDLHDGTARTVETGLRAVTWPGLAIDAAAERAMVDVGASRATFDLASGARVTDFQDPRAIVVDGTAIFRGAGRERIVRAQSRALDVDVRDFDRDGIVLGVGERVAHLGPRGTTPLAPATPRSLVTCADVRLRPIACREGERAPAECLREGPFCVLRGRDGSLVSVPRDAPDRRIPLAGTEGAGWNGEDGTPAVLFSREGRVAAVTSSDEDDPRGEPQVTVVDLSTGHEILARRLGWPDALSPDGHWLVMTAVSSPSIGPTSLVELGGSRRHEIDEDVDSRRLVFAPDSSALATPSTIVSLPDMRVAPIDPPMEARVAAMWWMGNDAVVFATEPLDGLHVFGRDGHARGVVPIPSSGDDEDAPHATLDAVRDRPFLATCDGRELVVYDVARGAVHARHANRCPYGGFDWADAVINAPAEPPVVSWDGALLIERESRRRAIVTRLADGAWVAVELVEIEGARHVVAIAEDGAIASAPVVMASIGIRPCGMSLESSPVRGAELRERFHRPTLIADLFAGRPLPSATPFGACAPR